MSTKTQRYLFILGISLPVVIIILLSLLAVIPSYITPPPKQDFLFTTQTYHNRQNNQTPGQSTEYFFKVENNKLNISARELKQESYYKTELNYFDAKSQTTKKIPLPKASSTDTINTVIIPEVDKLILSTSEVSKDGYSLVNNSNKNFSLGLFIQPHGNNGLAIQKQLRIYNIPMPLDENRPFSKSQSGYYSNYINITPLGWIENE